jgi:hypothetical protein
MSQKSDLVDVAYKASIGLVIVAYPTSGITIAL